MISNIQKTKALGLLALTSFLFLAGCSGVEIESRIRKETLFAFADPDQQIVVECSDGLQPTQAALINEKDGGKMLLTKCGEGDRNLASQGDVDWILSHLSLRDEKGKATFESKDELSDQMRWQFISQSLTSPVNELKIHFLDGVNYTTTDKGREISSYSTRPYSGLAAKEQTIQVGEAASLYLANNMGIMIGGSPAKERIH